MSRNRNSGLGQAREVFNSPFLMLLLVMGGKSFEVIASVFVAVVAPSLVSHLRQKLNDGKVCSMNSYLPTAVMHSFLVLL